MPGPATDVRGNPVVDPTANVYALVGAMGRRQDDLREMEARHLRELLDRDREHARELRNTETDRLNAIRAVDVGAVQRAAEVSAQQADTLAKVVASSAEALRVALAASLEPILKDIADLRRVQYEQAGQRAQVVETRDTQSEIRDVRGEQRLNINTVAIVVTMLLAVVALFLGLRA
jgi:hypothetical protein